jgi:phosphonate transport system substrate-binding protein
MFRKLLVLLLFINICYAKTIVFAPLPIKNSAMSIKEYSPMIEYLSKRTKLKFEIYISKDYKDFIDKFKKGKLDIIFIGSVSYIYLKKEISFIKPIVSFKTNSGQNMTTCSIITTIKDINNIDDIKNKKFALTSKYSSCGYLMSEYMLNKYNLSLKDLNYKFVGNSSDLAMSILLQEYDVGGIETNMAKKYESMGIKILANSENIPNYILAVNTKKIFKANIEKIKNLLLSLNIKSDNHILRRWGDDIKYGCSNINENDFEILQNRILESKTSK